MPIISVDHTCLVAISTLGDKKSNFFNTLIEQDNIFKKYEVRLICDICMANPDFVRDRPCEHMLDSVPHWLGADKYDALKSMIGEGSEDVFLRENLGLSVDENEETAQCFKDEWVDQLFNNERVHLNQAIRYVVSAVDPLAGSDQASAASSDFAVVTIGYPGTIILGMEAIDAVTQEDYNERLLEHYRRIFALRYVETADLILDVEAGTGMEAPCIQNLVKRHYPKAILLNEFEHRKAGTLTDHNAKAEMYQVTLKKLKGGEISIAARFVTTDPKPEKILEKCRKQLLAYEKRLKPSRGVNRVFYSGKGPGLKDDLSVTLQRALRTQGRYMTHRNLYYKRVAPNILNTATRV